jgi:hypothetical protein
MDLEPYQNLIPHRYKAQKAQRKSHMADTALVWHPFCKTDKSKVKLLPMVAQPELSAFLFQHEWMI